MIEYVHHSLSRCVVDLGFPAEVHNNSLVFAQQFEPDYFSSPQFRAIVQNGQGQVGLNAVGVLIWLILEKRRTADGVNRCLQEIFPNVAPEVICSDTQKLLIQLTTLGFLSTVST